MAVLSFEFDCLSAVPFSSPHRSSSSYLSLSDLFFRLLGTPLHTHHQTVAGMKPLVVPRAARPQEPLPAPACGTPRPATHLPVPRLLAETLLAMLRQATVEPQGAYAKTVGMKPQRQKERLQDTAVAGLKPHVQTEETNPWVRRRPRELPRGSLAGMKRLPVKWDRQRLCSHQERHQLEHQQWTWPPQHQVCHFDVLIVYATMFPIASFVVIVFSK